MILKEHKYYTIEFEEAKNIIKVVWKEASENMTRTDFKEQQIIQTDCIIEKKSKLLFIDGRNFRFLVSPDLQEWTNNEQIPRALKVGLKKTAIILPKELFSQVSVEQTMEEEKAKSFETNYFDDEQKARTWLEL